MNRRAGVVISVVMLSMLMLASLIMMTEALSDSARFGRLFSLLLLINVLGLVTFVVLIAANIRRLIRQLRKREPGSRLTLRMVSLFTILAVTPVVVVFGFSLHFLRQGIDSWFDVRIEQALDDALDLSRSALDLRMRELLKVTQQIAEELVDRREPITALDLSRLRLPDSTMVSNQVDFTPSEIHNLRRRSGAEELLLLSDNGKLIASSSISSEIVPNLPSEAVLLQLRQGRSYIGLDPIRDAGLYIRVVVNVPDQAVGRNTLVLQALYPVAARMNRLADNVQAAYAKYTELAYLREQLKLSFTMSLTLVLLFSVFCAVWAAFYSARRLSAPVRDLAAGTEEVARGNYETTLPVTSNDELGFLVSSFNEMTRKIAIARDDAKSHRDEVEAQRAYLEAVLERLSSGVMTLDSAQRIRTVNDSALQILGFPGERLEGKPLRECVDGHRSLEPFVLAVEPHILSDQQDWQEQVIFLGHSGRQVLMCRGTTLAGAGPDHSGHVVVFDDITAIIQGQRNAAWSEAARRLAHEIKNPLTPIQLSAERLRHKYLGRMSEDDAEVMNRLTNTIIQQVVTMKGMVNDFSEYARSPRMQPRAVDLNELVEEVLELFRSVDDSVDIRTDLQEGLPKVQIDANRMRQVFNNLLKNALEARIGERTPVLEISTRLIQERRASLVEVRVRDKGRGIPQDMIASVFDPYVTDKAKGTGLGLAIVKKIIEEHGGMVWMENNPKGGACAVIRLPVDAADADHKAESNLQKDVV